MRTFNPLPQVLAIRVGLASPAWSQALAVLRGLTAREASMLSFIQMFRLLGVVCFALIPLILLLRRPGHQRTDLDGMHAVEM